MTDRQSTHGHDCWGWGPKHYECAVREIERLAAQLTAAQRPAGDGCHCGTCTCNPNMTPAVRFDLSPAQTEGAIREHLIRLGWTPPDEHAALQAEVEALLRQALEALESADWYIGQLEWLVYSPDDTETHEERAKVQSAIAALRERLGEGGRNDLRQGDQP